MARYLLIRRTPLGKITAYGDTHLTFIRAAAAARESLVGSEVAGTANARLFADALARRPLGTVWGHPSGYDFRILVADFTEDGAPITPGLRVFNYYDRTWGIIEPDQFMRGDMMGPGGEAFDGWYDFRKDGEERSSKKLNGQRLAVKENPL